MRTLRQLLVGPLVLVIGLSSNAFAQQRHLVDPAALSGAVSQRAAAEDADRAAVREALARPEVRDVAAKIGLDMERVSASAETMSGDELARAASSARQVNDSLAGGASVVVISTTTIIIILLLVILIIVVAD